MIHFRFFYRPFESSTVEASDREEWFKSEELARQWFETNHPLWRLVRIERIP